MREDLEQLRNKLRARELEAENSKQSQGMLAGELKEQCLQIEKCVLNRDLCRQNSLQQIVTGIRRLSRSFQRLWMMKEHRKMISALS